MICRRKGSKAFYKREHLVPAGRPGTAAFMGMAGRQGMLRRTIYVDGGFNTLMILGALSGTLILVAFLIAGGVSRFLPEWI